MQELLIKVESLFMLCHVFKHKSVQRNELYIMPFKPVGKLNLNAFTVQDVSHRFVCLLPLLCFTWPARSLVSALSVHTYK